MVVDTAEGEGVMEVSLVVVVVVFGGLTRLSLAGCSLLSVAMDRFRGRSESVVLRMVALLEFCVVEEESLL